MDNAPIDELNERFKQLVIVAQKHLPRSVERQLALTKLVEGILCSGKLRYPYKGQYCENVYDEEKKISYFIFAKRLKNTSLNVPQ